MKEAKLKRRMRILRWTRRKLGLDGMVQISIFLQAYRKVSVELLDSGHLDKDITEAVTEATLVEMLAKGMIIHDLVKMERSTQYMEDDHIKGLQTYIGSIKVIV